MSATHTPERIEIWIFFMFAVVSLIVSLFDMEVFEDDDSTNLKWMKYAMWVELGFGLIAFLLGMWIALARCCSYHQVSNLYEDIRKGKYEDSIELRKMDRKYAQEAWGYLSWIEAIDLVFNQKVPVLKKFKKNYKLRRREFLEEL